MKKKNKKDLAKDRKRHGYNIESQYHSKYYPISKVFSLLRSLARSFLFFFFIYWSNLFVFFNSSYFSTMLIFFFSCLLTNSGVFPCFINSRLRFFCSFSDCLIFSTFFFSLF